MNSSASSPGYEVEDAHPRLIGKVAAIVSVTIVASLIVSALLYYFGYRAISRHQRQTPFTHSPEYKTSIASEWAGLDRENATRLHTYGWVDRPRGIVRIPIDRAMDRLVQDAANPSKP